MLPTPENAAYSGPSLSEEDKHVGEAVSVQEARQAELDEVIRMGTNIEQLIKELCPDGVAYLPLKDLIVANIGGGTPSRSVSEYWGGEIPWASVGDLSHAANTLTVTRNSITETGLRRSSSNLVKSGSVIVALKIRPGLMKVAGVDVAINQDLRGFELAPSINPFFLTYYFQTVSLAANGTIVKGMTNAALLSTKVPVPPVEVQEEIVRILDLFTTLEAELEAELEKRRLQYAHYRVKLLKSSGVSEFKLLGDIARIRNGKDHKHLADGSVPVYGSGGIMRYVETSNAQGPSVLIPRKGSLGNIFYVEGPFWNVDTIFSTEIDTSIVEPRFLFHQLLTMKLGEMNQAGGVPSQTQSVLNRLRILVPPIEEQRRIVNILDQMDALVNDLSSGLPAEIAARRKQYEHYRDRLLSFPELKKDEPTGSTEGALPDE